MVVVAEESVLEAVVAIGAVKATQTTAEEAVGRVGYHRPMSMLALLPT